jgi:hypothetical protein
MMAATDTRPSNDWRVRVTTGTCGWQPAGGTHESDLLRNCLPAISNVRRGRRPGKISHYVKKRINNTEHVQAVHDALDRSG